MQKNLKKYIVVLLWLVVGIEFIHAQDRDATVEKIRLVANAVIRNTSFKFLDEKTACNFDSAASAPAGVELKIASPYNDWRYWNGVLNIAMINIGETLDDSAYLGFAARNISFDFDNCGYFEARYNAQDKWSYPFGQKIVMRDLDDYGAMGASLVEVYSHVPQERYRAYIDEAANYILTKQHRLEDGTFVRAFPREWTLWADDLYMSVAFLSRMGEITRERKYFDDATRQVINFHKYLFDQKNGLMYHCWFSDSVKNGVAFWGRANGWMLLAQMDLLDRLPIDYPDRDTLLWILRQHIIGIIGFQDTTGLWHQLLDKPDSYLESSCSAMFTYVIARAIDCGYLDRKYVPVAERGWTGVMSRIHSDGQIEGVCAGTGIGNDLNFYYTRPTPLNDEHGVGVVILAGVEMSRLQK